MRVGTHDGTFHADEAFAIAALSLAHDAVEVVRTRDPERLAACDVRVDVGLRDAPATGDFDHHQKGGAGERPNGIRYASFGLVWREVGDRVCGSTAVAARVDDVLVQGVDAHDAGQTLTRALIDGVQPMTVSGLIAAMNPRWDEEGGLQEEDRRFTEAVDLARGVLEREIAGAAALARARDLVADAIARASDPRLIELEAGLPWRDTVVAHAPEALFVVYPKSRGWGVQAVPRELGSFANRLDLPSDWAGRSGAELAEVTGVPDAVFCHTGRFIAVAASREGAVALARQALAA